MDRLDGFAAHHLGAALGVADVHPEQTLHDGVKHAAGELPPEGLFLLQHGAGHPAGADHAVGRRAFCDEVVESGGRGGAVGVDVADEVGLGREFEALDQCAALADWFGDVDGADLGELGRGAFDDSERVVGAAVEHDDEVKLLGMVLPEIARVGVEHRADAGLLVVGGDQQEDAGGVVRHGNGLHNATGIGNAGRGVPRWFVRRVPPHPGPLSQGDRESIIDSEIGALGFQTENQSSKTIGNIGFWKI